MVEVKIADEARSEANVPGEILVRGYNTMLGVLQRRGQPLCRALESRLVPHGRPRVIRPSGHLVTMGRITDMIISGGANIYAREIENVVLEMPGVAMAAPSQKTTKGG